MSFLTWRRAEKKPPSQTRVSIPSSAASRAKGPSRKQTSVTSMPRERLRSREWTCVFAPVSYTHLDVYKRQGEMMPNCASRRAAICASAWAMVSGLAYQAGTGGTMTAPSRLSS